MLPVVQTDGWGCDSQVGTWRHGPIGCELCLALHASALLLAGVTPPGTIATHKAHELHVRPAFTSDLLSLGTAVGKASSEIATDGEAIAITPATHQMTSLL
jgi:hypothetical protein